MKQIRFIDEKADPEERRVARAQLQRMVHYAECATCRRADLLEYFGETYPDANCGACDNCLTPRETFDGTLAAQKLLSSVWRAREASFSKAATFGLNHHIEVLTGADSERIRKWRHEQLSTYGIGKEHSRFDWQVIGRELMRLGLLRQADSEFPTVEITEEGLRFLKERRPLQLTRPPARPKSKAGREESTGTRRAKRTGEITCDEMLFESLRRLRREIADSRNVAAYIIFSDVSLRIMARDYPTTEQAFANITGVGARKLEEFGAQFMDAITKYLRENPRQSFE